MNANYLKILIPLWSLGIIAFIILSPTELKILPMLAVIFMATGINYSLFKYLKAFPSEKSNLYYMNPFNQFEKTVKIAKPLRMIGLVFFMFQMILWLDIIEFEYDRYVFFLVIIPLLSYIFLAIHFYNSRQKSED